MVAHTQRAWSTTRNFIANHDHTRTQHTKRNNLKKATANQLQLTIDTRQNLCSFFAHTHTHTRTRKAQHATMSAVDAQLRHDGVTCDGCGEDEKK
jgi:hypothetical protein